MMKTILFSIAALLLLAFVAYIVMAVMSQKTPNSLGLSDDMLKPCPNSPNCVCSEDHTKADKQHFIAPLVTNMNKAKQMLLQQGGKIESEQENYVHATFTTPIFRYVDDVELRFEPETGETHIRSASRIGRSDFGVNRKRVETIKEAL